MAALIMYLSSSRTFQLGNGHDAAVSPSGMLILISDFQFFFSLVCVSVNLRAPWEPKLQLC